MPNRRTFLSALLLSVSIAIAGCADLPTAPEPVMEDETSYELLSALAPVVYGSGDAPTVTVLERSAPLVEDETVTKTIGRWGGVIRLREAGLTVIVPFGAVHERTEITVTAPAGDLVGYEFGPHGIEFRRPLTMMQDMTRTKGLGLSGLSAVYFDGDLEPEVTALERIVLRLFEGLGIFRVNHFCGYVIATN